MKIKFSCGYKYPEIVILFYFVQKSDEIKFFKLLELNLSKIKIVIRKSRRGWEFLSGEP